MTDYWSLNSRPNRHLQEENPHGLQVTVRLLLACSALYLLLGDVGEAALLSTAIFVVIAITLVQERRTERSLDALRGVFEACKSILMRWS